VLVDDGGEGAFYTGPDYQEIEFARGGLDAGSGDFDVRIGADEFLLVLERDGAVVVEEGGGLGIEWGQEQQQH